MLSNIEGGNQCNYLIIHYVIPDNVQNIAENVINVSKFVIKNSFLEILPSFTWIPVTSSLQSWSYF